MGLYSKIEDFIPQWSEVHALLEIPLKDIMDESNISSAPMSNSYMTDIEVPSFKFKDQIVWGATAMMLNEIRSLLKTVL